MVFGGLVRDKQSEDTVILSNNHVLANSNNASIGDTILQPGTADGGTDLAYLRKEYRNRPGFRGQLGGTFENFVNAAKLCNRYGWRVATHALGDAAIDFVLDVYEAADQESPISEKRWSIEHGYFLHPEHYDRIKKLGRVMATHM